MPDCQNKSDAELVQLSLQDQEWFRCLIERWQEPLLRFIHRLTRIDRSGAEDILQDIFIKAFKNLNAFDPDFKFSTWVFHIARNETISHWRKSKPQAQVFSLDQEMDESGSFASILEDTFDLREEIISQDVSAQVRDIIDSLPLRFKEVLILHFLEQKTHQEISDILRKPAGTIATLIHRAKAKFKVEAEKQGLDALI